MPTQRRRCAPALLAGLLIAAALPAALAAPASYRGKATDAAFAALLSMPTAKPANGRWIIPTPDDFTPADEQQLIGYLERQLEAGAQLDESRHFGTLLQHAIRAGLDKTALWLLEHGADPSSGEPGDDALSIARRYRRDALAATLISRFGLREPPPPARPAPAAPTAPQLAHAMYLELISAMGEDAARQAWRQRQLAALAALPAALREAVLADGQLIRSLVAASAAEPAQLAETLDLLLAERPVQPVGALLDGMLWAATATARRGAAPPSRPPIGAWRLLWQRLGTPLDYAGSGTTDGRLLAVFPAEHLAELFASGYARLGLEAALGCHLSTLGADQLAAQWPLLSTQFPQLAERAPGLVLEPFLPDSRCRSATDAETLGKLRFLAGLGSTGRVSGLDPAADPYRSAELVEAIKGFAAAPADPATARLRAVASSCAPALTTSLYRRLVQSPGIGEDPAVAVDSVQWLALPGEPSCALLVMGYEAVDPYRPGDYDSFDGPYTDPRPSCPDPQDGFEIWHEDSQGRLRRITAERESGLYLTRLVEVEDRKDGQRYFLTSAPEWGRCRSRAGLPRLLRLEGRAAEARLVPAELAGGTREVLLAQCGADRDGELGCVGLPAADAEAGAGPAQAPTPLATLLESWPAAAAAAPGVTRHAQYQAAVMALDRPTLKALMADGVPGAWTRQALLAVSASDLPLGDKRRRIAWLFHDHAQLARALDHEVIASLRPWLPLEDWGPVLRQIRAAPALWNAPLVQVVEEESTELTRLDCALQHAQQLLCGGGWQIE